ncbi:MAG TPA: hypothetical protein VLA34_09610, partial [Candidatus Krumholzibacterium sp.]|nr:hypothetical protein [Candidatus Krumholzibacterium sp.]
MPGYTRIYFFLIMAAALIPASSDARTSLSPPMSGPPPLIDGILDDGIWTSALSLKDFKTCMPDYGLDMSEDTEVLIAYDSENLYFAFRCYDSDPARIKTSVTRRDNMINDDWVSISLDSFDDRQTLYRFYVNPEGIQMDARATGTDEDFSIDFVWYSEG